MFLQKEGIKDETYFLLEKARKKDGEERHNLRSLPMNS